MPLILPDHIEYNSKFFDPKDLDDAKRIVLGHGFTETDRKWKVETFWNQQLFKKRNFLNQDSIVLDWGVGIGRLSKMMIETFDCQVIGVDISRKMLSYAAEYVNNDKFRYYTVDEFINTDFVFTNATATWAIQHSITPDEDLQLIKSRLIDTGVLFVLDEVHPVLPTTGEYPWYILKRKSIDTVIKYFKPIEIGTFPQIYNIPENENSYWGFFK